MAEAICTSCGAEKDLPLGRCGACRHLPVGEERELAVLASRRVLGDAELAEVAARLRRGERLQPSSEARARARAILFGVPADPVALSPAQRGGLLAANVVLTPALGLAVWFRLRRSPGPGARQALWVTVPVALVLAVAWVVWFVVARVG